MKDSRVPMGIVMPAYNAGRTIVATVERIPVDRLPAFRLVVVDDGSTDDTVRRVSEYCSQTGIRLEVVRHGRNRGYGAAQKTGFARSLSLGHDVHVLLHSDGQYAPEELPVMVAPLLEGMADVVLGSKMLKGRVLAQGMPLTRYLGSRLITGIENLVFRTSLAEFHSGYMAYSTKALETLRLDQITDGFHFDGEVLMCSAKTGLRIAQVPISTNYGKDASSLAPLPYLVNIATVIGKYLLKRYWFQQR